MSSAGSNDFSRCFAAALDEAFAPAALPIGLLAGGGGMVGAAFGIGAGGLGGTTLGGDGVMPAVHVVKSLDSSWRAFCWGWPKCANGAAGVGCRRASVRSPAAVIAASKEDVFGMEQG